MVVLNSTIIGSLDSHESYFPYFDSSDLKEKQDSISQSVNIILQKKILSTNQSKLPSKWRKDLPKPPIPSVIETFSKYLINQKSILPYTQHKILEQSVDKFINSNDSRQLQRLLEIYASRNENWVTELWLDDMYLRNQVPLPVNSNPAFLLARQQFDNQYDLLWFAAHFIRFAGQFKDQVESEQLQQDAILVRRRIEQDENNNQNLMNQNFQSKINQSVIENRSATVELKSNNLSSSGQSSMVSGQNQSSTNLVIGKQSISVPLCMQTYKNMFRAYRRPGDRKDELLTESNDLSNHIVIACHNKFFALSLSLESTEQQQITDNESYVNYLYTKLIMIWEFCQRLDIKENLELKQEPVGLFTTEHRHTWWLIRNNLIKKPQNLQSLTCIEKCLFVLCLDDLIDQSSSKTIINEADQLSRLLHGSLRYSSNRWFDKFLNVIIGTDGVFGFLAEHSASEGLPVIRFGEEFLDYWNNVTDRHPNLTKLDLSVKNKSNLIRTFSNVTSNKLVLAGQVIHLQWHLDTFDISKLNEAKIHLESLIEGVDLCVNHFDEYGGKWIKENQISPDCFVQLALQIVFYKLHGKLTSTYESAGLRRFKNGRVDNIRSNTVEALLLSRALCDELPNTTQQQMIDYFNNAINKQQQILKETITGYGIDNHIVGIREMAMRHQSLLIRSNSESSDNTGVTNTSKVRQELPEIFTSDAFKQFVNFQLSTSQVASPKGIVTAYGAVVRNGFGCCYNILSNRITFMVSSFLGGYNVYTNTYNNYNSNYSCSDANIPRSKIFAKILFETFDQLKHIVQCSQNFKVQSSQ